MEFWSISTCEHINVLHLSLELSERFLGSKNDLTLLEADATIIGLYYPNRRIEDGKAKNHIKEIKGMI